VTLSFQADGIASSFTTKTIVHDNQRLLKPEDMFTTDQEVMFFHISIRNPLAVCGDLQIRSTKLDSNISEDRSKRTICDETTGLFPFALPGSSCFRIEENDISPEQQETPPGGREMVDALAYAGEEQFGIAFGVVVGHHELVKGWEPAKLRSPVHCTIRIRERIVGMP
jgi:hypothetical protein